MNLPAFLLWDKPYTAIVTSPVCNLFEKSTDVINGNPSTLRLLSPFTLLNAQTHIEDNQDSGDFKYEEWRWKELHSFKYLDKLKEQQPQIKHIFIFKDYRTTVNVLLKQDFQSVDNANRGSLLWRFFRRKRALQQFYSERVGEYLAIWLKYNEEFAANVETLDKDSYVLLDQKRISSDDASVSAFVLKNWNLSLKYVRLKQVSTLADTKSKLDIDTFPASLKNKENFPCEA